MNADPMLPGEGSAADGAGEPGGPQNVFLMLHRLLRGRYKVAVPTIVLLALVGGAAGWMAGGPEYTTVGVVEVKASLDKVLYDTEMNEEPEGVRFFQYVQSQAALFTLDKVLLRALEDRALTPATRELGIEGYRRLLEVQTLRDKPTFIYLRATSDNPETSKAVVSSTIDAFMDVYGSQGRLDNPTRVRILRDELTTNQNQVASKRSLIRDLTQPWGAQDLDPVYARMLGQQTQMQDELRQEKLALISLRKALEREQEIVANLENLDDRAIEEVVDLFAEAPRVQELSRQRAGYERVLRDLRAAGILEGHRDYKLTQRAIATVDESIRDYVRARINEGEQVRALEAQIDVADSRVAQLTESLDLMKEQLAELGRAMTDVEELEMEIEAYQRNVALATQRLEAIALEGGAQGASEDQRGRFLVRSRGSASDAPDGNTSVKFAAAGFVGAGGLAFVAFAGLGLLDRRVRYSDELSAKHLHVPPLLGVMPQWDRAPDDEDLPYAVANTVHWIRARLGVLHDPAAGPVVLTSALSGEGKTSIVLSLGISYAHAGARVLIVDFDLVGREISRQLAETKPHALRDAVASDRPASMALRTRIHGLDVLPATADDELVAARFGAGELRRFFSRLRESYDVVLVDTGPFLGSTEVAAVCSVAGGVILVIRRGTAQRLVTQCTEKVRAVGATVLGLVFNGATGEDFSRSPSSQSRSTRSVNRESVNGAARDRTRRWCPELPESPLADVVASTLRVRDDETGLNGQGDRG